MKGITKIIFSPFYGVKKAIKDASGGSSAINQVGSILTLGALPAVEGTLDAIFEGIDEI